MGPLAVRLYGILLKALPPEVRQSDGPEMVATFALLWRDAVGEGRVASLLARSYGRLPGVIVREWLDHLTRRARRPVKSERSGFMDRTVQSVRYGARSLGRNPAFLWTVMLLLALGVGGITTIFTLVDHVVLRPLPYPGAARLIALENGAHSGPTWRALQELRTAEVWGSAQTQTANLTGVGRPEELRTVRVSQTFLSMFGARPEHGRLFIEEDYRTLDAAVLSEGLWKRTFGADEAALGRTITLDAKPYVVVGIMDGAFTPPEALTGTTVDVWLPIDWTYELFQDPGYHTLNVVGRLTNGGSVPALQTEVDAMVERLSREHPRNYMQRDSSLRQFPVVPLHEATVGAEVRQGLGMLLGAVTLLLLVACTNVAHLFMARGLARVREMAVRRALGARTSTLAGQLFLESLMVGSGGAALGVILAFAGIAAFLSLSPESIPRADAVRIDLRVLGFAVAVSAATALLFGMLPALRLVGRDAGSGLNARGRGNSDTRRDGRLRAGLVVAEVALSLILVVQAGVLLRGFVRLNSEELGFRTAGIWTVPLEPRNIDEPTEWSRRMDRVRDAVLEVPGVRMATYGMTMPLEWIGGSRCCWGGGPAFPGTGTGAASARVDMHIVDAEYFALLELAMIAGQPWTRADEGTQPAPAVISEPLAIRVFGSAQVAIGRTMRSSPREDAPEFRITGVTAQNRHYGPDQDHIDAVYMPSWTIPFPMNVAHVAVLMEGPTTGLSARLRDAVWSVEPDLPIPVVRRLEDWAVEATARARFEAVMFAAFGAVALLLVSGGLYGTLLYSVGLRRRELGIRLALGDAPRRLEQRVLGQGVRTAIIGCAFGAAGAWAANRLLASRFSELETGDSTMLAVAIGVLCAVAIAASWLPARQAARTDPLEALRSE